MYEIEGQPRVGPIRVYDREVVSGLDPQAASVHFFEGNQWRGLLSDPRTFPPNSRRGTITQDAIESMRAARASAQEHNSKTEFAPQTKVEGDVLWSLDPVVNWFGVRSFARDSDGVDHEQLCLLSIRNAYWEHWHGDWVCCPGQVGADREASVAASQADSSLAGCCGRGSWRTESHGRCGIELTHTEQSWRRRRRKDEVRVIDAADESANMRRLKRRLKTVFYVLIPCQVLTILAIPAFPVLFLILLVPNAVLIGLVVVLDRRIVKAGGRSFWQDGKFTGFDR